MESQPAGLLGGDGGSGGGLLGGDGGDGDGFVGGFVGNGGDEGGLLGGDGGGLLGGGDVPAQDKKEDNTMPEIEDVIEDDTGTGGLPKLEENSVIS